MNQAAWDFFARMAAWLGMAALQASLVAAILLALARLCRQPWLRAGIVSLALLKFVTPPWLAWPLLSGAAPGAALSGFEARGSSGAVVSVALLALWAAGGLIALARWGLEHWKVRRLISGSVQCRNEIAGAALREAARMLGLRSIPELRVSRRAVAPFTAGVLRPVIVLPEHWLGALSAVELGTVLLHETAHVRRCDPLRLELVAVLGMAWWWNPLYHWTVSRWRLSIEEECDAAVLSHGRTDPREYGGVLLRAARLIASAPGAAALPACVAGMSAALEHRLLCMTAPQSGSRPGKVLAATALALLSLVALPYVGRSMESAVWVEHSTVHFFRHGLAHGHSHTHPMHP